VVSEEYEGKINLSTDELESLIQDITDTEYDIAFE